MYIGVAYVMGKFILGNGKMSQKITRLVNIVEVCDIMH